jgi:hypothetical protein
MIEAAKSRDDRIKMIDEGFAIEAELRDNKTLNAILAKVRDDADRALEELSEISPHDTVAISRALVTIRAFVYIRRGIEDILRRTQMAVQSLREDDAMRSNERIN